MLSTITERRNGSGSYCLAKGKEMGSLLDFALPASTPLCFPQITVNLLQEYLGMLGLGQQMLLADASTVPTDRHAVNTSEGNGQ